MKKLPKEVLKIVECDDFDWTQFEGEAGVYHESVGLMLDLVDTSNLKISPDIAVSDEEEWIYYTVTKKIEVEEISQGEYMKELCNYVNFIK